MVRVSHKSSLTWKNIILFAGIRTFRKGRKLSICMPVHLTQGQLRNSPSPSQQITTPWRLVEFIAEFGRPGMFTPKNFNCWRKEYSCTCQDHSKSTQISEERCTLNCIPRRHVYTRQCKSQISSVRYTFCKKFHDTDRRIQFCEWFQSQRVRKWTLVTLLYNWQSSRYLIRKWTACCAFFLYSLQLSWRVWLQTLHDPLFSATKLYRPQRDIQDMIQHPRTPITPTYYAPQKLR
jgi:hypothetical protein